MDLARALLGSVGRVFRGPWGRACAPALAAAALLLAPVASDAQGTSYVGDGGSQDDVIVNMDALDGAPASSRGRGSPSGSGGAGDQDFAGELVEGPSGVVLRYPPDSPPRSRLTVDPERFGATERTGERGRTPELQPPGDKPERTGGDEGRPDQPDQPDRQQTRTMAKLPPKPMSPPGERAQWAREVERRAQETQTADAGSAGTGSAGSETAESTTTDSAGTSSGTAPDLPEPPEAAQDGGGTDDGAMQAEGRRTPDRKPEPPADQATQMAETRSTDGAAAEAGTQAGAGEPEAEQTADAGTSGSTGRTQSGTGTTAGASEPEAAGGAAADTAPSEADAGGDSETGQTADSGTQVARLPEEGLPDRLRLDFPDSSAELSSATQATLDQLAQRLKDRPEQRIQLKAFAAAEGDNASRARRLSLSRALAVRSYLIDQGIRSTRMDVRALGNTADEGPLDRVDIAPATR